MDTATLSQAAVRLRLEQGVLRADVPPASWMGQTLRASSETTFFFLENAGEITFERNDAGAVVGAVVVGLGEPIRLVRR